MPKQTHARVPDGHLSWALVIDWSLGFGHWSFGCRQISNAFSSRRHITLAVASLFHVRRDWARAAGNQPSGSVGGGSGYSTRSTRDVSPVSVDQRAGMT